MCGPEVDEVTLHVVRPCDPDFGPTPEGERKVPPGIPARLTGPRHGERAPELLSRPSVVGRDETALLNESPTTVDPIDHSSVDDDRARGVLITELPVGHLGLPADLAGPRIQRDHDLVFGRDEDQVLPDREVPKLSARARTLGEGVLPLPQKTAVSRVERLHDVSGVGHVQHAVSDQGRGLAIPVFHPPDPGELQVAHVFGVDLVNWTVSPAIESSAPVQPVPFRRGPEIGVRHRDEAVCRPERPRHPDRRLVNLADGLRPCVESER